MKRISVIASSLLVLSLLASICMAQEEARVVWQVTRFEITANVQQAERSLSSTAVISAKNVGHGSGTTFTFRLNSKATVQSVTVSGASATFRAVPETQGNVQRITVTLPSSIGANATVNLNIAYRLPVESNSGLAAISPLVSQFLPLSFWYPAPNTPFTLRGADTAPFKITVDGPGAVSSGIDKSAGSTSVYEQPLNGVPFFVVGDWDRVDGTGESRNISAYIGKGSSAEEKRQAESLTNLAASARSFYAGLLGPGPDVPLRLIAVRRGSGFYDGGTVLLDSSAFRRAKIDSVNALLISEMVARLWVGNQTAVRSEGNGMLREGLTRFLADLFLEKQFGADAAQAELLRERLAYATVSKRDAPLSRATQLDDTYYNSVPNKGAMVWRLIDRKIGRSVFMNTLKEILQSGKETGITLAGVRTSLIEKGGEGLKPVLDYELDQATDTDLMIGLPQQRGAEWVSALRNLGSSDVTVNAVGITARGERVAVEATIPARGFAEAVFKTAGPLTRAEVDPEKFYPQLDYSNDVAPRVRNISDLLAETTRLLSTQDNARAENVARELLTIAPYMTDAKILLARALLEQNKLDESEKMFRAALDDPLPTPSSLAWGNIGLGQIATRKSNAAEAARRFNEAVRTDADYATSVLARAERIKAEKASGTTVIDDSGRNFLTQLDAAIMSGKKPELESRIVSGELVRFIGGIVGTQPELWQTTVLRTEALDANTLAADVTIQAKELGVQRSGTALLILSRASGAWKLAGIELFEVR